VPIPPKIRPLFAFLKRFTYLLIGDSPIDYKSSGFAKHDKGDLDGALADFKKAIELGLTML
jgi:hypothetical protein